MPFDENLVLVDGTVTYPQARDIVPFSVTGNSTTGAAVIDLQGGTPPEGLAAVLIIPDNTSNAASYIDSYLEASDVAAFTAGAVGAISRLGSFGIANVTIGRILGSETPCVVVLRFSTDLRYVRFNGTASDDTFGLVQVLISPYPWIDL